MKGGPIHASYVYRAVSQDRQETQTGQKKYQNQKIKTRKREQKKNKKENKGRNECSLPCKVPYPTHRIFPTVHAR